MKIFWTQFKFKHQILLRHSFVAFDSQQSEKATNARIVNVTVATIWVVLLDVFCSCVQDFYGRGKQVATWSSKCALTSLCRHLYVQCD